MNELIKLCICEGVKSVLVMPHLANATMDTNWQCAYASTNSVLVSTPIHCGCVKQNFSRWVVLEIAVLLHPASTIFEVIFLFIRQLRPRRKYLSL